MPKVIPEAVGLYLPIARADRYHHEVWWTVKTDQGRDLSIAVASAQRVGRANQVRRSLAVRVWKDFRQRAAALCRQSPLRQRTHCGKRNENFSDRTRGEIASFTSAALSAIDAGSVAIA